MDVWMAYAAATAVFLAVPGPTIMLVVGYALAHGRRATLATVAGVALGDLTAMTGSFLGLGALLATSATLYMALKWIGAAYLVYLGIQMWRHAGTAAALNPSAPAVARRSMFWQTYAVTALNPKSIIFFVAFLPQFIDPAIPILPQLLICGATFLVLASLNATVYAALAAGARQSIRRPRVLATIQRAGGTLLIGTGIMTAALRRSS